MSTIGSATNNLLQSQLTGVKLRNDISYRLAAKSLDVTRTQGDAAIKLLDQAAELAQEIAANQKPNLTMGAIVSGLGQNLDACG